jgi:hypothetical protein
MPNTNKHRAANPPDTTPTKRPCPTASPPALDLQLAQIYSAITAATALLPTLTTTATNLATVPAVCGLSGFAGGLG